VSGLIAGSRVDFAAVPTAQGATTVSRARALSHFSQAVSIRYWLAHPDQAPAQLRARFQGMQQEAAKPRAALQIAPAPGVFNLDSVGLPQDEESIAACRADPSIVLGGTNDYRGILDPEQNTTGWHLSLNGGDSVANEGLLPSIVLAGTTATPSGGDPVVVADQRCRLFAGTINYDPADPNHRPSGVGVYRSNAAALASCPGGSDPACWPVRRAVAEAQAGHLLDKDWLDVGVSGTAGEVVWVVYSDFVNDDTAPLGYTSASINAVRCNAALTSCTPPILISGADRDVQNADVTIGPDGRVYVTWSEIKGELPGTDGKADQPQTFIHKLRIAPAGGTSFGPTRVVAAEDKPLPFDGFLHANDFRISTYPKNEVVRVGGRPRVFVVWDACAARVLDSICEEPQIKLRFSDDGGASWSRDVILSQSGDNYFPTISQDGTGWLAVAWYTNRFDPLFHNKQNVELVTLNAASLNITKRQIIVSTPNETEADPLLNGLFIGDYFEVFAHRQTAWVHFNANYRKLKLLGDGFPVPQQDNYLSRVNMSRGDGE